MNQEFIQVADSGAKVCDSRGTWVSGYYLKAHNLKRLRFNDRRLLVRTQSRREWQEVANRLGARLIGIKD